LFADNFVAICSLQLKITCWLREEEASFSSLYSGFVIRVTSMTLYFYTRSSTEEIGFKSKELFSMGIVGRQRPTRDIFPLFLVLT